MSRPGGGLLPALIDYYRRLEEDPERAVAGFGFAAQKVHFRVVLEPDGALAEFEDIRDRNEKGKPIPATRVVPDGGGRSGTGFKPFFCWDNTGYALGRDNKGNPARAAEMFAAFRDFHLGFREELAGDEGFAALCRFLEAWDPARAEALANWEEAAGSNVVFRLRGREGHIHESRAVQDAWSRRVAVDDEAEDAGERVVGPSLVGGEEEPLARLHPQIRGVAGANTTGAAIVSFNLDAFESYGKTQSYNAPVGTRDAFRYATALNRLLADARRRTRIGDATVVYWSDRPGGDEAGDLFGSFLGADFPRAEPAEDAGTTARVGHFLESARRGLLHEELEDPDAPFYILGLSPNASRLNVRYWLAGTVRQFAGRLAEHLGRLEIVGARPDDPPPSIRALVGETAREPKDVAPQLAGEVARAVLAGLPYPQLLFNAVVRRIRAEPSVNHRRASILKAYLIRNHHVEVPMALDKEHPDEAYQLGRLFAAIEYAQTNALGDVNRTVKDAYFGAASATPATVFPRLLRLHQHHVEKLPTGREAAIAEKKRTREFFERLVQEITGRLAKFPAHLTLERQGLFFLGYYHQRQDFFTKRSEKDNKETTDE